MIFYSDLACERRRVDLSIDGVNFRKERRGKFLWERIFINSEAGAASIGRPMGNYDTLTLPAIESLDGEDIYDAAEEISRELCAICDKKGILPGRILIAGLGNGNLTPDSVGPKTAAQINATMHIKGFSEGLFEELECSEIAVCAPGVSAFSGMDAAEVISGICNTIKPDVIFAVDALAAGSPKRLGRTIQISDTGIFPGSGIGNTRAAVDEKRIGVPVISLGVPTVINAEVYPLGDEDESEGGERLFVSPKDIDTIVAVSSKIIATGINQAFGII